MTVVSSFPGRWSLEEDIALLHAVEVHGTTEWKKISCYVGKAKSASVCKCRWNEYIKPLIEKDAWTEAEDKALISLGKKLQPQWGTISECFSYLRTATRCHERYKALTAKDKLSGGPNNAVIHGSIGSPIETLELTSLPKYTHKDKERLTQRLKRVKRREVDVVADGNSMYRALSHQLFGLEKFHYYVRERVVQQLKEFPGLYCADVAKESYNQSVNRASRDGVRGNFTTLQAASDVFKRIIVLVVSTSDKIGFIRVPQCSSEVWETLYITFYSNNFSSTEKIGDMLEN